MVAFPLKVSSNGRYLVDQNGTPFQIHGEAAWDIPFNFTRTDWQTYMDDRKAKGITALLTYPYSAGVQYVAGESSPYMFSLGDGVNRPTSNSALPFAKNTSGGTWDGDPTFSHFDADFSSPNDGYFAQFLLFLQDAAARGMLCLIFPCYCGFGGGTGDGWGQTLTNSVNTLTVCTGFGTYLANGHGTFSGFKSQANIMWILGGDTMPPNGGTEALRLKNIILAIQAAGDTHLVAQHWQHDFLPNDQTDLSGFLKVWSSYTHGNYPSEASTAAMGRQLYSSSTGQPAYLIETDYWANHSATRATYRLFGWHARLSSMAGYIQGSSPLWVGWTSLDGTTGGTAADTITTAWTPNTAELFNNLISHAGNWYRCTVAGTTAASGGPTGTGTAITDGTVTWTFIATQSSNCQGFQNLFNDTAIVDHKIMGAFFAAIAWWLLVPSGLGGTTAIVTAGGGTAPTFTDQNFSSGGLDYVASAVTPSGDTLVAYVPHAHSGAFTVDMTRMGSSPTAYWVDPTTGAKTTIGAIANVGTHNFTVPGANAGGDNDWVLLIQTPNPQIPSRINSAVWV